MTAFSSKGKAASLPARLDGTLWYQNGSSYPGRNLYL